MAKILEIRCIRTRDDGNWTIVKVITLPTAIGAIDMTLRDIKGKEAGMPVHRLLGGPCPAADPCYAHGGGGMIPSSQAKQPVNAWVGEQIFDEETLPRGDSVDVRKVPEDTRVRDQAYT